jgi:hypothetical protein
LRGRFLNNYFRSYPVSKEQRSNKESKKKPAMTAKEKKAAKKTRKESRGLFEH